MIIPLFQLDKVKTIAMLKEKNKISSDIVVQQLEPRQDFLFAVRFYISICHESRSKNRFFYDSI